MRFLVFALTCFSLQAQDPSAIAEKMWTGLQHVPWDQSFQKASTCAHVPPHKDLREGIFGYAYHCSPPSKDLTAEYFYYPFNADKPVVLLRRADFHLTSPPAELSEKVETLLR